MVDEDTASFREWMLEKTLKGLRFYTYQEAANWLECSITKVEEMVAHM